MTPLRQAIRSLSRHPNFAATAIITIALSIAANTAVYAVVHAVLLAPLPFRQPQDLVQVWETHPALHNLQVAVPDYLDWKRSVKSIDLAAYTFQAMDKTTLLGRGAPMAIQATNASPGLFDLLGIKLLAGRVYTERDGKQPLILISERLCRERFSADSVNAVGQAIQLGGNSFTIVGVVSQRNSFPVWADIWMPFSLMDRELIGTRKYHPLEVIGRLAAGAPLARAESELEATARQIAADNPATNARIDAFAVPLLETVVGEVRTGLLTSWIAVGLVLGIACANLAHLMMGHALSRRNEVAIRLALGAGRLSVLRTFLIETGVLALCGWLLGVLAAHLALPFIERLAQGQVPRLAGVALDWRVLLFGLGAAVLTAVLFAMPAYSSGNMHTYRPRGGVCSARF